MQYQGNFMVNRRDQVRYNLYMCRKSVIRSCLVCGFLAALALFTTRFRAASSWETLLAQSIGFCAVVGAAVYGIRLLWIDHKVSRFYRAGKLRDIPLKIVLDKRGVHASINQSTADTAWKHVLLAVETATDFYLFIRPAYANVLPKKQMQPQDAETIRAVVWQYLDGEKCRLHKK